MRYWICIAVWFVPAYSIAQNIQDCELVLRGIVLDEHNDATLGYATIYIPELDKGVVSDSTGRFLITGLCAGIYTLQYNHIGCEGRSEVIRLRTSMEITLQLEHHAELLHEIELHARRIREAGTAASGELKSEVISENHGQSLGQLLQQLPGVHALQTGPAIFKPVIHGLHSNRVLIVRNQLRLESQQWGLDHAPEIDPSQAGRIRVIKGAAAVEYGTDAIAGVVVIEPEQLPDAGKDSCSLATTMGTNGRSGVLSMMYASTSVNGTGIRGYTGVRRAGDAHAAEYLLTNTGVSEASAGMSIGMSKGLKKLSLEYQFLKSSTGILRSAHIGNLTDLQNALMQDRPLIVEDFSYKINQPKQIVTHHTAMLSGQTYLKNTGMLQAHYALQWNLREEFDIRRGMRDDIPALSLDLKTHTGTVSFAHQPSGRLHGKWTMQSVIQVNENMPGTGVRPLIPNYVKYTPAISLVEKWVGSRTEAEIGIRYEPVFLRVKRINAQNQLETPERDFHTVAGASGVRHEFSDQLSIAVHAGHTRRAPSVNELFSEGLHHGAAAIEEGDSNLVMERAWQVIGDVEMRKERWQAHASFYIQHIDDFIYLQPLGEPRLTIRGAFPVFRYVQSDVTIRGADLSFQWQFSRDFTWQIEASLLRARDRSQEDYLIGMPSDRMKQGVEWKSRDQFECGLQWEYVWKQSRVPVTGDYAPSPAAYHLFSLQGGVAFAGNKGKILLTIRNLLNTSYREYLNRLRYYADDTGRSIELRLRYSF